MIIMIHDYNTNDDNSVMAIHSRAKTDNRNHSGATRWDEPNHIGWHLENMTRPNRYES